MNTITNISEMKSENGQVDYDGDYEIDADYITEQLGPMFGQNTLVLIDGYMLNKVAQNLKVNIQYGTLSSFLFKNFNIHNKVNFFITKFSTDDPENDPQTQRVFDNLTKLCSYLQNNRYVVHDKIVQKNKSDTKSYFVNHDMKIANELVRQLSVPNNNNIKHIMVFTNSSSLTSIIENLTNNNYYVSLVTMDKYTHNQSKDVKDFVQPAMKRKATAFVDIEKFLKVAGAVSPRKEYVRHSEKAAEPEYEEA